MKIAARESQKAFSLIEVMVAIVVLALGILAVAQFQGALLRSGADANQRVTATRLAEEKLEEFRVWSASGSFDMVADSLAPEVHAVGDAQYDLSWNVVDYYFQGPNQAATTTPNAAGPNYKEVLFTVSWVGLGGNERIQLSSVINALGAASTGLDPAAGIVGDPPSVFYDPLEAPDVVPVRVGDPDIKMETSKPLPDVSKKEKSTATAFEVVTFAPFGDQFVTLRRQDFLTISCECTASNTTTERVEGITVWDPVADILRDQRVRSTARPFGTVDNSGGEDQLFECDVCCRNKDPVVDSGNYVQACRLKRIDGIMTVVPDWKLVAFDQIPNNFFDANATGFDSSGNPITMTSTLAQGNIDTYSDYVIEEVRNRLAAAIMLDMDGKVTAVEPTVFYPNTAVRSDFHNFFGVGDFVDGSLDHKIAKVGNVPKLSARAVYMDLPPKEVFDGTFDDANDAADSVPLVRIPFFTVNITNLAAWVPDGDRNNNANSEPDPGGDRDFTRLSNKYGQALTSTGAPSGYPTTGLHDPLTVTGQTSESECNSGLSRNCVTNEELRDRNESVFTRGDFYANQAQDPETVTVRVKKSNSGLTDTVQDGKQNVTEMPSTFSEEFVDSTIDMVVKP